MLRKLGGAVAALALVAAIKPALAADAQMIEAAKKEGEVVWYTTLIVDQLVRPLVSEFEKKYGIKVVYFRANASDLAIKVINEAKAGRVQSDVADGTSTAVSLVKAGVIDSWLPEIASTYPKHLVDPGKQWISTNLYVLTPGFNTQLVKKGTEPKTFADLLDPKWRGKLTWSSSVSSSGAPGFVGTVLAAMGEKDGMAYLRKLAEQKIVNRNVSAREVLDQVIAGESAIALQIFNHHTVISAQQGAPSDWIPMEPATVNLQTVSVVKNAIHPNAAKLLVDYMVSDEGQMIFQKVGYLPAQPRIPAQDPKLKPEGGNFQALYMNPAELDEKMPEWVKLFGEIFR
jgi:ABC-type Fe3+ transport system substrate-binding protein